MHISKEDGIPVDSIAVPNRIGFLIRNIKGFPKFLVYSTIHHCINILILTLMHDDTENRN